MARFDVYRYDSPSVPLVVEVQADLLSELNTCVVLPMVPEETAKDEQLPKLKPVITIGGANYILITTDIGAIKRKSLGSFVTNIEGEYRQDIIEAIDFLLQGF